MTEATSPELLAGAIEVADIHSAGSVKGGEFGIMNFIAEDKRTFSLSFAYHLLPKLANAIHTLAKITEPKRNASTTNTREVVFAYDVLGEPRVAKISPNLVVVEFPVSAGFPFRVALTADQALRMAEGCKAAPPASSTPLQ